ncbi:unnamed protein product [Brassica oleracea var. botrytis]|uniref:(rape) hypothetical protein n=1 Tax=Brassica napus TaxID=3708 RepID=A0A816QF16_BRANA|nr:unnamed protein product [Brassica napus]
MQLFCHVILLNHLLGTLATSCLYRKHLRKSSTGNLISSPSSLKLISYLPLISSSPSLYFVSDRFNCINSLFNIFYSFTLLLDSNIERTPVTSTPPLITM